MKKQICLYCKRKIYMAVDEFGFFYYHANNDHESCDPEDPDTKSATLVV